MRKSRVTIRVGLTGVLVLLPTVAHAYIGPGAGLSALAGLAAVAGAVILALFGVILFPIRMLLLILRRRARGADLSAAPQPTDQRP